LGTIQNFHPFVNKSYYTTDQREGISAQRICELSNGLHARETATVWQDGESLMVSVMFEGKPQPPISDFSGTLSVYADGANALLCAYPAATARSSVLSVPSWII